MHLEQVEGVKNAYDLQLRRGLTLQAIQALQDAGVEPDVWKGEGLDRQEDGVKIVEMARRGGRNSAGLIVLGPGAERDRVVRWLKTAPTVPGFTCFSSPRPNFCPPLIHLAPNR